MPVTLSKHALIWGGAILTGTLAVFGAYYLRNASSSSPENEVADAFREMKRRAAQALLEDAAAMFEDADTDNNGVLSRAELEAFTSGHPEVLHVLNKHGISSLTAFEQMDVDADGVVSRNEWLSALIPTVVFETTVMDIFAGFDVPHVDGVKKITKDQFKAALASMGTLEEIVKMVTHNIKDSLFDELDKDGDNMLDANEFIGLFASLMLKASD